MNGPNEEDIKTFFHYEIVEKIGRGGMAEVFLARDTLLDRHVALKLLPESQQDDTAKKRFLREAKSAAALDHPYICKIYETGEAEGRPFIAMEYVRGETLAHRMARESLTLDEARKIALEIAEALEAAHAERIAHRDLKPSNIMLTEAGHVKVLDFALEQIFVRLDDDVRPGQKAALGIHQRKVREDRVVGDLDRSHGHGVDVQFSGDGVRRTAVSITGRAVSQGVTLRPTCVSFAVTAWLIPSAR